MVKLINSSLIIFLIFIGLIIIDQINYVSTFPLDEEVIIINVGYFNLFM